MQPRWKLATDLALSASVPPPTRSPRGSDDAHKLSEARECAREALLVVRHAPLEQHRAELVQVPPQLVVRRQHDTGTGKRRGARLRRPRRKEAKEKGLGERAMGHVKNREAGRVSVCL